MNTANSYCREMDAALEAKPPVIVWRKNKHGVLVHVSIDDPHTQVVSPEPIYNPPDEEAFEVAERFRKHRADNTPFLAAARRSI